MTGHMVLGKATLSDAIANIQVHFEPSLLSKPLHVIVMK